MMQVKGKTPAGAGVCHRTGDPGVPAGDVGHAQAGIVNICFILMISALSSFSESIN